MKERQNIFVSFVYEDIEHNHSLVKDFSLKEEDISFMSEAFVEFLRGLGYTESTIKNELIKFIKENKEVVNGSN